MLRLMALALIDLGGRLLQRAWNRLADPPPMLEGPAAAVEAPGMPLPLVIDLAVESWRLDRWLQQSEAGQSTAAPRFVSRRLADLLARCGMETVDLTGQPYEPGLAIELVGTVVDETLPRGAVVIDEMVAPLCIWNGKVVRLGQAVTRSSAAPTVSGEA